IVGDLERLPDRNAVTVDIGERGRVGFSKNRASATGETDQRTCLHRLQRSDLFFTQGALRLKAAFGREVEHLTSRHSAKAGGACKLGDKRDSNRWIGMHLVSCHDVERQRK